MGKRSAARRAWRVARGKIDPRCDYCGIGTSEDVPASHPQRATVEDIVPLSKGGRNNRSNWALACCACNQAKGDDERRPPRTVTVPGYPALTARRRPPPISQKMIDRIIAEDHRKREVERLARLARQPTSLLSSP